MFHLSALGLSLKCVHCFMRVWNTKFLISCALLEDEYHDFTTSAKMLYFEKPV